MDRKQLETILKINGFSSTSSDAEIKAVLLSARYSEKDVQDAINLLRYKQTSSTESEPKATGLQKVFRTDEGLKPSEISKFLNIDVNLDEIKSQRLEEKRSGLWTQSIIIVLIAILAAALIVTFAMYYYNIGIFHPTVSILNGKHG